MALLSNKLNPQGQRLLTIIVTVPLFVTTSYILYKRLVLDEGKPPRHVPAKVNPSDLLEQYQRDIEREQKQQQEQQQKDQKEKSV